MPQRGATRSLRQALHLYGHTVAPDALVDRFPSAKLRSGNTPRSFSPKAEELLRISNVLNVSMEWLLTGNGDQKSHQIASTSAQSKKSTIKALNEARQAIERAEKSLES